MAVKWRAYAIHLYVEPPSVPERRALFSWTLGTRNTTSKNFLINVLSTSLNAILGMNLL